MPAVRERSRQICFSPTIAITQMSLEELWNLHQEGIVVYQTHGFNPEGSISWLDVKHELAMRLLHQCNFCVHNCQVNRLAGETGYCGLSSESILAGEYIHYGEEALITPTHAVFFSGCTMHCVYCHAWRDTFHLDQGRMCQVTELVDQIKLRQNKGAIKTISFIGGTPEPNLHFIIEFARQLSSDIGQPFVFNSNATLSSEGLALMEGVIDIYLPDFKHGNDRCAKDLTGLSSYYETITNNLNAYVEQRATVLIRHLVIPKHLNCCTYPVLAWIAEHLPQAYVNVMYHYRPLYQARYHSEIDRRLEQEECKQVTRWVHDFGLQLVT